MSTDLVIRNVDDLMALSKVLAHSELLPKALAGKPANVAIILMYGAELRISPGQSLRGIHVIEGRPELSAQLWNALTRRAGHSIEVLEHTTELCRVRVTRGDDGKQHTAEYKFDEAVQAGKVTLRDGKPYARSERGKALPWETVTLDMLLARALSRCCRFICPEVALGFYAEDEVEAEEETVTATAEVLRQEEAAEPEPVDAEVIQGELADIAADYAGEPA